MVYIVCLIGISGLNNLTIRLCFTHIYDFSYVRLPEEHLRRSKHDGISSLDCM